jgi:hypothetical protein
MAIVDTWRVRHGSTKKFKQGSWAMKGVVVGGPALGSQEGTPLLVDHLQACGSPPRLIALKSWTVDY